MATRSQVVCILLGIGMIVSPAAVQAQTSEDCIIDTDAGTVECDDLVLDLVLQLQRYLFDQKLERIKAREATGINGQGLYERYFANLSPSEQATVTNLSELSTLLAASAPELYRAFIVDTADAVARLRRQVEHQTQALVSSYQQFDPLIGTDPGPIQDRGILSEALDQIDRDRYAVSGTPAEILAVDQVMTPISFVPLEFSSLSVWGPYVTTGNTIDSTSRSSWIKQTCSNGTSVCVWPVGWDLQPYTTTLVWESSQFLTQQEVEAIVLEDGYRMTLSVNGNPLRGGPPIISPSLSPLQDYTAATLPTLPCPAGLCIAVQILVRDRLRQYPMPWEFRLEVEKIVDLDIPKVILDDFGNLTTIYKAAEPFVDSNVLVLPNPTSGQSWFEEALVPTFKSARCVDCHSLSTPSALAYHHDYADTHDFIDYTGLVLEPSAYVPGAHVITCGNCHHVSATDYNGNFFEEVEWKVPYVDLDVNWGSKTPAQICGRVISNLPTHNIRYEHFHEDGRLFWAIEVADVMGTFLEPRAEPKDYEEFLSRVDIWNNMGIPCP